MAGYRSLGCVAAGTNKARISALLRAGQLCPSPRGRAGLLDGLVEAEMNAELEEIHRLQVRLGAAGTG